MLRAAARTVHRARALRRTMSLPEIVLWRALRQRPGGFKFRKQHPAGPFVLDFFCAEVGLCIEIDGEAHSRGSQPEFDGNRSAWLALHGIAMLRIGATDVLNNLDGAVAAIVEAVRARLPLHQPAAGPAPRAGEELKVI